MTNLQIITNSAVANGLFTEEEVRAIFASGGVLPLFTFKEWKRRGYQVRRGEHAALTCDIWRHKEKKGSIPMEDGNDKEVDESHFYKHKAFLFTKEQVDRIEK